MPKQDQVHFRRSPHVISYWDSERLIFENFAVGTRAVAEPITTELLHFFDRWRSAQGLFDRMSGFGRPSVRQALRSLVKCALLERSDRPRDPRNRQVAGWGSWNPVASYFHFSTKYVPNRRNLATEVRGLRQHIQQSPRPNPLKRYRGAALIPLPPARAEGEFASVLLARRTWRKFSERPVDLADLSTLLRLTWGVQRWWSIRGVGRVPLKTSPSGGACHPLEVYILARRIAGLPQGLYHYVADRHELEVLCQGPGTATLRTYIPMQWWYQPAAALLVMTAVFPRKQWKYESPRAYRSVLLEAGHFCQTFCLVGTWLGLAPFCTAALDDSRIEHDLGVDGVTESVLYAAGIGCRPPGATWAPWPDPPRRPSLVSPNREARAGRSGLLWMRTGE